MTGADLIRYYEFLKTARQPIEQIWRECYQYTFPIRGTGFTNSYSSINAETAASDAKQQQARIYDSEAAASSELLASAIVSNMTPANMQWFNVVTDDAPKAVSDWMDKSSKTIHGDIHASNFDAPAFEKALDIVAAGMGCMYAEESDEAPYHFELWPLYDCFFAASKRGQMIDTIYRRFTLTAQQAVNEYGEENVSDKVKNKALKEPYCTVQFIHAIYPKPKEKGKRQKTKDRMLPFASMHVEVETKKVCKEAGYAEFPCSVPRYIQIPGSVYAIGPMSTALPDTKTLNDVEKLTLANGDMQIAGMWGAVDDGVINPKTVRIGARKIIMMASKDSFFPLNAPGKFDVSAILTEQKRKSIRRVLKADMLEPLGDGPAKTATEWHYRINLIRQLLGPTFGRLQSEDLQPLVFRCFGIALRAGRLGTPPEELRGKRIRLKYVSPLARAQQMEEVAAMDRHEQGLGATAAAKPDVLDTYDWDEAARKKGELLGVSSVLILDADKVKKVREDRIKAQQQAQAQEAAARNQTAGPGAMPGSMPGMPAGGMM